MLPVPAPTIRKSLQQLFNILQKSRNDVPVGGLYVHYKDTSKDTNHQNMYKIVEHAIDESSEQPVVIYQSLKNPKVTWVRTLSDFTSDVHTHSHDKSSHKIPRFSLFSNDCQNCKTCKKH